MMNDGRYAKNIFITLLLSLFRREVEQKPNTQCVFIKNGAELLVYSNNERLTEELKKFVTEKLIEQQNEGVSLEEKSL